MTPIATRQSWKIVEAPEQLTPIEYEDDFTEAEYEAIERGLIPQEMEDKWFIFYEEPVLFFYLSWLGELIYRVTLERDSAGAQVIGAELSPKYPDPSHAAVLPWVVRHVLLGQNIEFPE
jgi:hypothetical protein